MCNILDLLVLLYCAVQRNILGLDSRAAVTSGSADVSGAQVFDSLLHQAGNHPLVEPLHCDAGVSKIPVCDQCGKTFKHARNIKRHYQAYHQMYCLPCEHCNQFFSRTDKLRAHMRNQHGIGKKLVCSKCKLHFPGEIYLEKHYRETGHDQNWWGWTLWRS